MSKKSQVTIYIFWFISAIIIVLVAAVLAPMGVRFTSEMVAAGEAQFLKANESISEIQNETIKASIESSIGNAFDAADQNIEIQSDIFQYSWVLMIVLTALVAFLFTRQIVEVGRSGGGGFV